MILEKVHVLRWPVKVRSVFMLSFLRGAPQEVARKHDLNVAEVGYPDLSQE